MPDPLLLLAQTWKEKLKLAREHKQPFQDVADECLSYYCGPADLQFGRSGSKRSAYGLALQGGGTDVPLPSITMRINKAAEMVQLFGPHLYPRDPERKVTPRKPIMVPVELFGPMGDPVAQGVYQSLMLQVQARDRKSVV